MFGTEHDRDARRAELLGGGLHVLDQELDHRSCRVVAVLRRSEHLGDTAVRQSERPHIVAAVRGFQAQDMFEEIGHGLGLVRSGADEPDLEHLHEGPFPSVAHRYASLGQALVRSVDGSELAGLRGEGRQ